nr:glycosyl hydrolase family protein [Tanacetum cinerariifolium]
MGVAMVQGFQGNSLKSGVNIVSTLKHFTAYGVPEGGHNGGSISTGQRELFQSFLPPFRAAVKAGAQSIMTAYNSIDGVPCSANTYLLTDVLQLLEAVQQKLVAPEVLDRAVGRVLRIKFEMGLFENPYVDPTKAAKQ